MKKNILMAFMMMAVLLLASGAFAYKLDIKLVSQDPFPAQRGESVDLYFKASVINSDNPPTRLLFSALPEYPFTVVSDKIVDFGNAASIPTDKPITFKFRLLVDKNAAIGNNTLKVGYGPTESNLDTSKFDVSISETRTDFDAVIQDISTTDNSVSIGIVNSGKNPASSVIVKIPAQDNFAVSGTSANIVGDLNKGDFTLSTFKLIPKSNEEQNLKVEISYTDTIGNRYIVEREVPLKVDRTFVNPRSRTQNQNNNSPLIIVGEVLGVLVVVYLIYRFTKRKQA